MSDLTLSTTMIPGDLLVLWKSDQGNWRGISGTDFVAWLETQLALPAGRLEPIMQYAAPTASGFSVTITDDNKDVHLILTPTAGFAAGTIILPSVANLRDNQLFIFNCTQIISALTININGAVAIAGAPSAISANSYFTLKYDAITQTWYQIG